jgi:ATP-binding cassette, subfamily B, heavy metal transporter
LGLPLTACPPWRRGSPQKFREKTNAKDNEVHEKATDALINFETVKSFTQEDYELQRFRTAIVQYQVTSCHVT